MSQSLKRVGQPGKCGLPWLSLVDFTFPELVARLQDTMPDEYTWQDFLTGGRLHIDHIIPVTKFCFTGPQDIDFKRCWSLGNLRLLPAGDNRRKSNHITEPFQPALPLAI